MRFHILRDRVFRSAYYYRPGLCLTVWSAADRDLPSLILPSSSQFA
jgi:hypothetical protein